MKNDENYTYRSMRDEREYGPYWYSLLWRIVRPVLILAGSLLVGQAVCGVVGALLVGALKRVWRL